MSYQHAPRLLPVMAMFIAASAFAQAGEKAPENWQNLDIEQKVYGVSTEKAYTDLLPDKAHKTVVVAVIDGGVDIAHEDLKGQIWINQDEIAGNNIDDDHNGYIDDVNGWNFIGGAKENVNRDNLEVTRLYARLKPKYEGKSESQFTGAEKEEFKLYQKAKAEIAGEKEKYNKVYGMYKQLAEGVKQLENKLGKGTITVARLEYYEAGNMPQMMAKAYLVTVMKKGQSFEEASQALNEGYEEIEYRVKYAYDPALNTRSTIVGDDENNPSQRYYGNNNVVGPDAAHGTHVAGIIAALRNNGHGYNGIAADVKIMVLRVVPNGDERDKDVANAIRYAADNGAQIINMSFGKYYVEYKNVVDSAVQYAVSKNVLLVHAAGNESKNIDEEIHYPNAEYLNQGGKAGPWIEVGASSWHDGKMLVTDFSNWGPHNMDVFAPGEDIYSTIPGSKYQPNSGTSMAAPVVSGVAAVVLSYYPNLSAGQLKYILLESAVKVKGKVYCPGTHSKVKLKKLCSTGGIVNLYQALKLAEQTSSAAQN